MNDHNPYAPPTVSPPPNDAVGVWRYDESLVISKQAEVPTSWCVKTNQPTEHTVEIYHDWNVKVTLGLSQSEKQLREWRTAVIYRTIAASVVLTIGCSLILAWALWFNIVEQMAVFDIRIIAGVIAVMIVGLLVALACVIAAAILGILNAQQIFVYWTNRHHIYISNLHPDFLARFPDWQRI